jgi:Tol biopolymer transport system component
MRKRAFVLCLPIVFAAAMLTAEARAATQPPILYDGGLRCLAKKTGVGNCNSASYNARIYVIAKIGFPAKALTTGKTNDIYPVWSPNRKQIAFYSAPTAGLTVGNAIPAFQLWLMNANGTGQHKIGSSLLALGMSGPTWSANGSSIVFAAESPDGKTRDLYSIKTNGTGLTDLTKNPDSVASDYPSESPDGAKIVFRHETTPGFPEAYSIAADGSSSTKLFRGGIMFAWRHDDQQVAFVANSQRDGRLEIFLVPSTFASAATQLTNASQYTSPSFAPNGTQIVVVRANQITIMNADGSQLKQLTKKAPKNFVANPDW